jgi:hypothetical protein
MYYSMREYCTGKLTTSQIPRTAQLRQEPTGPRPDLVAAGWIGLLHLDDLKINIDYVPKCTTIKAASFMV